MGYGFEIRSVEIRQVIVIHHLRGSGKGDDPKEIMREVTAVFDPETGMKMAEHDCVLSPFDCQNIHPPEEGDVGSEP